MQGKAVMPAWVLSMREAAMNAVKEADIKAIVENQVKAAKKGDKNAIKFVFEQLIGGGHLKGATFIQNNFAGDNPAKPTKALPGTQDRVEAMRQRVAAGGSAFNDDDAEPDLS